MRWTVAEIASGWMKGLLSTKIKGLSCREGRVLIKRR